VALAAVAVAMPLRAQETGRRGDPRIGRGGPDVGRPAPDFELPRLGAADAERVRLSAFRGKRPVVLIFSSYT